MFYRGWFSEGSASVAFGCDGRGGVRNVVRVRDGVQERSARGGGVNGLKLIKGGYQRGRQKWKQSTEFRGSVEWRIHANGDK